MRLRFSLKWLLLGFTYLAIAAAGLSQPHPLWEKFLWLLTGGIVAYAVLATCILRGGRQAIALGFSLFACSFGVTLHLFPQLSPVSFVAYVRGFVDPAGEDLSERTTSLRKSMEYEMMIASQSGSKQYRERIADAYTKLDERAQWYESLEVYERAANPLSVALAGVLGAFAGGQLYAARLKSAPEPVA